MPCCLNPTCHNPLNPEGYKFCQSCGSKLEPLLRNRYRVIKPIGGGGFGKTYLAEDIDCMNAPCVVKQFSPSPDIQASPNALQKATELFNQEGVRLFELGGHPQIPRLLAHFEQEKRLYLVQEWIDGQDLLKELGRGDATVRPYNEEKVRSLLTDLLPVLKFVHEHGVIHRDIKPENLMRRRQDGKLVLIDFGVSKQATVTMYGTAGTTVGTPGYAPLEQMRGQAFPASDLYSLGVTCVCLLTQCLPTDSGSNDLYNPLEGRWMWRERLSAGTKISPTLAKVLDKLLQDYVKDRYQSADEVLQALNAGTANPPRVEVPIPETVVSPPPESLNSAVGIDYRKLRDLLAAKKWKEADQETASIMLKVSRREKERFLTAENLDKFPCEDFRTINELWVKYSNGQFGFSVQRRIWQQMGGRQNADGKTYALFGDRVGWRARGAWLYHQRDFNYTKDAPIGHLPVIRFGKIVVLISALTAKLVNCNIQS